MQIATKQEIRNCIKYGGIGLLAIFLYFHIDVNSQGLFWLVFLSIWYLFVLLEKQIIHKCIIARDIIPVNENAWDSKYPQYHTFIDGTVTTLIREFSFPFPPYQGLAVSDSPFHSEKIESVTWDDSKKRFICKIPPIKITENHILGDVILDGIKVWGWQIYEGDSRTIEALEEARKKQDEEWVKKRDAEKHKEASLEI